MTALPLNGFTVIDLTAHRAGPTAVRQLADWGADVIKIEMPGEHTDATGSRRDGPDFQNLHRNKRSLTPRSEDPGRARRSSSSLPRRPMSSSRISRSTVKHRLGVDYEAVKKVNPRIVYGSISGFGQDGPYEGRPGVDQIAQGMGGLMSITGLPGPGADPRRHRDQRHLGGASCSPTASRWRSWRASAPARGNGSIPRCSRRRSSCSTSRPRATR